MSDSHQDVAGPEEEKFFSVTIMVRHPIEKLEVISNELGLQPDHKWQAGEVRTTPKGTSLPGINKDTYWGASKRVTGCRSFSETIVELLIALEAARDFILGLLATGGAVTMVIHLPGHLNIGGNVAPNVLLRLGRLGIELSVEVFPDMW